MEMKKNIYYEGELINRVGIDRIVLNHVELIGINREVLSSVKKSIGNLIFDDFSTKTRTYY